MIKKLVETHYGLRVQGLARVREGVGGEVYITDTDAGRFVLKGTPHGSARANNEPYIAARLARQGIPVAEYLRARDGEWFVRKGKTQYLLQRFVEGKVYAYHEAPAWFLPESARMGASFVYFFAWRVSRPTKGLPYEDAARGRGFLTQIGIKNLSASGRILVGQSFARPGLTTVASTDNANHQLNP